MREEAGGHVAQKQILYLRLMTGGADWTLCLQDLMRSRQPTTGTLRPYLRPKHTRRTTCPRGVQDGTYIAGFLLEVVPLRVAGRESEQLPVREENSSQQTYVTPFPPSRPASLAYYQRDRRDLVRKSEKRLLRLRASASKVLGRLWRRVCTGATQNKRGRHGQLKAYRWDEEHKSITLSALRHDHAFITSMAP